MAPRRRTPPPTDNPGLPPTILTDQAVFETAVAALALRDPGFIARTLRGGPAPALRRRAAGLEGLAGIVVAQQVSTASAAAIFGRLKARLGTFEAASIAAASDADLRLCGLSAPKLRTIRALAEAERDGGLDFARLAASGAEAAHATLCSLRGIGPWTADVFLLFCLGHADTWPAGDLALQEGARLALDLDARPDAKALLAIGERWRPLRGVAAHCLWAYYGIRRNAPSTLESAPAQAATQRTA